MRRAARITAWIIGSVGVVLVLLAAAALIAGNTAGGRALIEQEAARFSGGKLRLAGLAGRFPEEIRLEQLQLADAGGVWLTAQQVSLRWSPLALLTRHLKIGELKLARLDIERRPVTQPSEGGGGSSSMHVDLEQLSIDRLELGPELAGTRVLLSVRGALHYRSLSDATAQVTARRSDGRGDYELTGRLSPARMDANLKLEEPANGPLENLLGYPGLGALAVQATLGGPRDAEELELNAQAGALHAAVHGTLDLKQRSADLDYQLDAPAMTPRPGLSWQRLSLHGRWQGPARSARADARLELAALEVPGGAGVRAVEATLSADRGALTLHAEADGLTLPGPEAQLLAKSPLHLQAAVKLGDPQRPLELAVQHPLFTLEAHANTAGARRGTFDLHLPDLSPLAAIAGEKIAGRSEIRGTLRQEGATTHLEARVDSEISRGPTLAAKLLAGASRLELAATLAPRSVAVERLALSAQKLSVSASGAAQRGPASAIESVQAQYTANLADLSPFVPSVAGSVSAHGTLDGPLKSLAAKLQLTSSLSVRGAPRETLNARIAARGLPAHASAEVQAGGRFAGAPVALDASLERGAGEAVHLTVERAEWKSAHLHGDLTTGADLAAGHGALRLRIERLADLEPLVGTSLAGSLEGSLELRPGRRGSTVRARLDGENLVAANLPANVLLTADGPTDALDLKLSVRSPSVGGEPASLESASRLDLSARTLAFERLEMHYRGQTLRLLGPARVSFADGLAIGNLELGMQHAVMTLDGRISPALDLRASLHHVDPALINAFLPGTLAQGTLDAEARLEGPPATPSGLVTLTAAGVRLANPAARDLHALDVRASAHLTGGSARLDVHLDAGEASRLALTGSAPVSGGGGGGGPLDLKLTGKLDAALVNPLLEAQGQRATGTLTVDATVNGTASAPEVRGTVDLTHGELRDYVRGVHLSDMTAHLVGEHGTLRIARFTARTPPGELSMTGTIGVLQPKFPIDVELVAKNARPVTSNIVTASLDGDIKVTGTLRERVQVSGSINLHRAEINIPNTLPPDVAVLDVRRPGQAPPPPTEHKLVIALDVRLHAPRETLVQGRGLDAELGGDLHLSGTTDAPRVNGGFELVRGTFALAGSTLTFTKGEVTFSGTGLKGGIDPTLDFTAQSTVSGATATLHITGFADAPRFELSSSPGLPQDEILARLLFGESAAQLTTVQVAEIGAALATLGGIGGGGPSPLVRVQKALGLDRLSVGSASNTPGTQNSGTTLEAGRYVSSRVYVGARQSTTGFSQAEVDVDLSKHLKLQTRLGNGTATTQGTTPENDPGSSIGLTYQFEY